LDLNGHHPLGFDLKQTLEIMVKQANFLERFG
jgi:hypothetical protein